MLFVRGIFKYENGLIAVKDFVVFGGLQEL